MATAELRRRVQGAEALRLSAHRHRGPGALPADPPLSRPRGEWPARAAFFRCWSRRPVNLPELVAVAGMRWGVEDCFSEAKGKAGLDRYQACKCQAWYRHATLSMLAHAFLAVTTRASRPGTAPASGTDRAAHAQRGA